MKAVWADKLLELYKWTIIEIVNLFKLLEIYFGADKKLCNWSNKVLNTINIW